MIDRIGYLAIAVVFSLTLTTVAHVQCGRGLVTLRMDGDGMGIPPGTPINGLTVKGVTFADTTGAHYRVSNGGFLD
jgi:hypothetical protein